MPWGSTNVNETGSQADSPVRAKETSRLSTAASGEMLSTIPPPRSIWVEPGRGGRGVAVGRGVGVGCGMGVAVGCGVAVDGTGVGVKTGVPVAAGTGVGEGAVAGRRTGTGDRTTLGGGVAVGTTAVASMETGAVAVASSSTDSVQAAKTRRITAADEKAVVTFKELQTCFVRAASRRRASNQSVIGGFYSQADSLGVRMQGLNFSLVLVLGCPWFSRPGGPLVLVTIGQRSLEGAMNVHVYTQPG